MIPSMQYPKYQYYAARELCDLPVTAHAYDTEFLATTLPPTNWSAVGGSFSATAIDPTAGFSSGGCRADANTSRLSWLMMQPHSGGSGGIYRDIVVPTNFFIWARLSFNSRGLVSPTDNDMNARLILAQSNGTTFDFNNCVQVFVNESDTGTIQAQANILDGGVGIASGTTLDVYARMQSLEMLGIQKIGTTYTCWAGTAAGAWMYLCSGTQADSDMTRVGLHVTNAVTTAPGCMIFGCDFIRFYEGVYLP